MICKVIGCLTKCLVFSRRIHHNQIVASQVLLDTIDSSRQLVTAKLQQMKVSEREANVNHHGVYETQDLEEDVCMMYRVISILIYHFVRDISTCLHIKCAPVLGTFV